MSPIDDALASLESLNPGESVDYTQVAKKYKCDRNTLSRRHRGVQGTMANKIENSQLLSKIQEKELIKYIDGLCERGLPPSRPMIRNFASEMGGRQAGKSWVDRFIKRFDIDLISRWTSGMDTDRERADPTFKYSLYFDLLQRKIEQYKVDPRHTYNMDEKGFLIGILSRMERIFTKQQYEEGGIKKIIQDGNCEWITTIACICADGTSLTPALIYQALTGNLQDTWSQDFDPTTHKAFFASSPSGWTNNTLGMRWLEQVFDRETKAKARQSYRLLILDGHGAHVTMEFINYCDNNKILLALYPPQSTHTLQPLDVCLSKPLSAAYSAALADHMDKCQGLSAITKRDFFRLFNQAWQASFKAKTILSAFEKCGLHPFNPHRVLARFSQDRRDHASSSESSTSVLSASDWRKIERLLREVVADVYDKGSQQLNQTLHSVSIRNALLEDENNRLREALVNEKRKRQGGKALLLEPTPEYNGRAQKNADAEEQLREIAEKAEKVHMLEERKRMRPTAKEIRLQTRAQKVTQREAAKLRQQLIQHQAKASQKGKGKQKGTTPENSINEDELDDEESNVELGAPTPARSRRC